MAHAHYGKGSYRWLLLGDDDTLWFMRGMSTLYSKVLEISRKP